MNKPAILSSIFLGLTLPAVALAKVPTQNLNQEQFTTLETVEIAQRYLSYQDVSSRLKSSESRILNMARGYSGNQPVRWDYISVEQTNNQEIKLNVHGKIMMKKRKPPIRIGLKLRRNSQGGFTILNYDWSTGRRCRFGCERRVRDALRNLPSEFPRFQRVLNSILS